MEPLLDDIVTATRAALIKEIADVEAEITALALRAAKGDLVGHEFHGNQWTQNGGGKENTESLRRAGFKSLEEYQQSSARAIKDFVATGNVSIRVSNTDLNRVLRSGRYKSGAEVGQVMGGNVRLETENRIFGLNSDTPAKDRPVYGLIDHPNTTEDEGPDVFGGAKIVLKDDVKDRTTITIDDSNHQFGGSSAPREWTTKPLSATNPEADAIQPPRTLRDGTTTQTIQDVLQQVVTDNRSGGFSSDKIPYVEAQIFGGVKVSDIARVEFRSTEPPSEVTLRLLNERGIPYATSTVDRPGLPTHPDAAKGDVAGHEFHGNQWTQGGGEWKPVMTRAEAEAWAKDSVVKEPLFHGAPAEIQASIRESGFRIGERGGVIGSGVYLTNNERRANAYTSNQISEQSAIETRINVRNVAEGDVVGKIKDEAYSRAMAANPPDSQWAKTYGDITAQVAKEMGYDAIKLNDEINVLDPRNVVIVDNGAAKSLVDEMYLEARQRIIAERIIVEAEIERLSKQESEWARRPIRKYQDAIIAYYTPKIEKAMRDSIHGLSATIGDAQRQYKAGMAKFQKAPLEAGASADAAAETARAAEVASRVAEAAAALGRTQLGIAAAGVSVASTQSGDRGKEAGAEAQSHGQIETARSIAEHSKILSREVAARSVADHATLDKKAATDILRNIYGDSYLTGSRVAAMQLATSVRLPATVEEVINASYWDAWEPGLRAAAEVVRSGAFADLLDQAGIGDNFLNNIINGIFNSAMDRFTTQLASGLDQGLGADAMAATIADSVSGDAQMIAVTETARAQSAATADIYGQNGVEQYEWLAEDNACTDGKTTIGCRSLADNGPYDMPPDPSGDNEEQPSQPWHPNCRCTYLPVVLDANGENIAPTSDEGAQAEGSDLNATNVTNESDLPQSEEEAA